MKRAFCASAAALALFAGAQASAQTPATVLPQPEPPFSGVIGETLATSEPAAELRVQAPAGAPNVFVFMGDDVGFSMSSTFGGPVATPNMDRLAAAGQRYNRFHTTAICSPTRAALLTGRNAHNAGMGMLADLPSGFPGYRGRIPASTATIAQVLRLNGYNTAMFGKHHNIPPGEASAAGPFDSWPTGLGFEYFFGIPQGESDQWSPVLYRGISQLPPVDGPATPMDRRLADDAIRWIHNQKAAAPDKPFFVYYAPGSTHAPHQAPADWIAKFAGRFDQGWDQVREETWRRQLALGIIPPGTKLTSRPDAIPAWSSLSPAKRAFAAKSMEVAAAMLAYQDAQLGRVLDELERMGQLDNTLVMVVQGDNGASGEGGVDGTTSEFAPVNGLVEDEAWLTANVDRLGGPGTYGNYPIGWAWAMNAPLRWTKQYASMLGGIRNGMIVSWAGHIRRPGSICAEFGHVVDIAPTVFQAAHVTAPEMVNGVKQKPLDGQSLLPSLTQCSPGKPRTQYFEMIGKAGLYKDGWFASNDDGRQPKDISPPAGPNPPDQWTLYNLDADFSQSVDVAAANPERLKAMVQAWRDEARRNDVFPVNHSMANGRGQPASGRARFDFWGKDVSIPAHPEGLMARNPFTGSFSVHAELNLASDHASGVVLALGSKFAGWSLYLDQGRPTFVYAPSMRPENVVKVVANRTLSRGPAQVDLTFTSDGMGKGAKVEIRSGDTVLASGRVSRTFLMPLGVGEMLDAGQDTGVAVTNYPRPHGALEGDVLHIILTAQ